MSSAPTFVQEMPLRVKPGETVLLEITARPHGETFAAGRFRLELTGPDLPAFVYLRGEDRDYKVPVRDGAAEHARLPRGRYGISLDEPPPRDSRPGRVRLVLSGDAYEGPLYLADARRVYELKRDGDAFVHESVPPGDYELRMDQPEPRPGAGGVRLTLKAPESGNAPARAYLIADGGRPPVEVALRRGNGELTGDYPDLPPGKYRLSMSPPDTGDAPADNWLRRGDGEKLTIVFQDEKNMGEAAAGVIREMAELVGGSWGENLKSVKFIAYAAGEGGTRIRRESEALARSKMVAEAFDRELKGRRTVDTRANFETNAPPGGGDVLIVQAEGERGPLLGGPSAPGGNSAITRRLADKEKYFFESCMKRISPMGMYHHRMYDGRDFHTLELGDSCAFGGFLLQGLAFKYACVKDARSLGAMRKIIGLYKHYYDVTKALTHYNVGVEPNKVPFAQTGTGQLCRMIVAADLYEGKKKYGDPDVEFRAEHRHGATHMRYIKHGDYYYRFDISMDQYINAIAGLLMCRNMVSELRGEVDVVLANIKNQLINKPCVKDEKGLTVRYGDLDPAGACEDVQYGENDQPYKQQFAQWLDPLRKFMRYAVDRDYDLSTSLYTFITNLMLVVTTLSADAKRSRNVFNELMATGLFTSLLWDEGINSAARRAPLMDLILISTTTAHDELNAYQDVWGARFERARDNLDKFPARDWRRGYDKVETKTVVPLEQRAEMHCFWEHSAYIKKKHTLSDEKFPYQPRHYNGHDYLTAYWAWRFFEKYPQMKRDYQRWMIEAWKKKLGESSLAGVDGLQAFVDQRSGLIA